MNYFLNIFNKCLKIQRPLAYGSTSFNKGLKFSDLIGTEEKLAFTLRHLVMEDLHISLSINYIMSLSFTILQLQSSTV